MYGDEPHTARKHKSREIAEGASNTNRSVSEALQLHATDPLAPPDHFQTFKLLMEIFAGLLAVLFGAGYKFHSDMLGARMLLGEDGVAMLVD